VNLGIHPNECVKERYPCRKRKFDQQEIRSVECVSAQCCCIPYTVTEIFDYNCNDLNFRSVQGHPRPKVMVPIKSPWAVSYLTSFESNIASLTVFEIFDIKDISIGAMVRINSTSGLATVSASSLLYRSGSGSCKCRLYRWSPAKSTVPLNVANSRLCTS